MIPESSQFSKEKKGTSYRPVVFAHITVASGVQKFVASRFIDVSADVANAANWSDGAGADYDDRILSIGSISKSVDPLGGLATLANVNLSINDLDGWMSWLLTSQYPEGRAVEVFLIFDDGTPLVFAEAIQIYGGNIESVKIEYQRATIKVSPAALGNSTSFDWLKTVTLEEYPEAQPDVLGKAIPVVYGDHIWHRDSLDPDVIELGEINQLSGPCQLVNQVDRVVGPDTFTDYTFVVASHAVKDITQLWIYDDLTGQIYKVTTVAGETTWAVTNPDANGNTLVVLSVLKEGSGPALNLTHFWKMNDVTETGAEWIDKEDAADDDNDSFAQNTTLIASSDLVIASTNSWEDVTGLPGTYVGNTAGLDAKVFARDSYTGPVTTDWEINGNPTSGDDATAYLDKSQVTDNELTPINCIQVGLGSVAAVDFRVYEVFKTIFLKLRNFSAANYTVLVGIQGVKDDGSGTYTGTPDKLIENPIDVQHHYGAVFAGLPVDSTQFAAERASRASWIFSPVFLDLNQTGNDVLDALAKSSLVYLFTNNEGDISPKPTELNADLKFEVSGSDSPALADVHTDSPLKTFTIIAGLNDKLDFDESAGELTATLTAGVYTASDLADEIEDQMNAVGVATFAVSYSSGDFTIEGDSGNFELLWDSGSNAGVNVGQYIGFDISADDTGNDIYVSDTEIYDDSFFQNMILLQTANFDKLNQKFFANSVLINYGLRPYTGDLQKDLTITDATSQTNYGTFNGGTSSEHIFDVDTITLFAGILIQIMARRWFLSDYNPTLDAASNELGDVLNLQTAKLSDIYSDPKIKKWQTLRVQIDPLDGNIGRLRIQAMERS